MKVGPALVEATKIVSTTSDSPRLDAEVLLAFVLRCSRSKLLTHPEAPIRATQLQRFRRLIQKRKRYHPIPYLTGTTEFFGLALHITPAVLVPRPFTELLVESVLRHCPKKFNRTLVDVGTGSGAIGLALAAQLPQAKVISTDISETALAVARRNAKSLGLQSRTTWRRGSLLQPLRTTDTPYGIISNLPYLTASQMHEPSLKREPKLALHGGRQGMVLIKLLLRQTTSFTSLQLLALEFDPAQTKHLIKLVRHQRLMPNIETISDGRKIRGLVAWN